MKRKLAERRAAMQAAQAYFASMTRKQIDAANRKHERDMAEHWRAFDRADRAMRRAWLKEHPAERPLPHHLCELENPFPGHKRWCARALKWIAAYDKRTGF